MNVESPSYAHISIFNTLSLSIKFLKHLQTDTHTVISQYLRGIGTSTQGKQNLDAQALCIQSTVFPTTYASSYVL